MVQKKLPFINSAHGSETRNIINEVIKAINDRGLEILSESGFLTWLEKNGIKHREEVATFNDLPSGDSLNTVRGVVSDNKIYIKKENGWIPFQTIDISKINEVENKTAKKLDDIIINIRSFGASEENTAAENTNIIQGIFDQLKTGQSVLIPDGDFKVTNLVFNPPNDCGLEFKGILTSAAQGVALKIGDENQTRRRYTITDVSVVSATRDWTERRVGVQAINLNECHVTFKRVIQFRENVQILGLNSFGNVHNDYHTYLNMDGKVGMRVRSTSGGWANENTFYGGRYAFGSIIPSAEVKDCIAIIEEEGDTVSNAVINNNRYMFPSIEAGGRIDKGIVVNGLYTYIFSPRMEGAGIIELTEKSRYCLIFPGRGLFYNTVINNGIRNKVWTRDVLYFDGGTESDGTVIFKNAQTPTGKIISGLDPVNAENFTVYANGKTVAKGDISARKFIFEGKGRELSYAVASPIDNITSPPGGMVVSGTGGAGKTLYLKEERSDAIGWKPVQTVSTSNSSTRPNNPAIGFSHFDSSLQKPIWWNGTKWIDAVGNTV